MVREVYLAQYKGQTVAVKLLKMPAMYHTASSVRRERMEAYAKLQHWAEFAAMDAVCPHYYSTICVHGHYRYHPCLAPYNTLVTACCGNSFLRVVCG